MSKKSKAKSKSKGKPAKGKSTKKEAKATKKAASLKTKKFSAKDLFSLESNQVGILVLKSGQKHKLDHVELVEDKLGTFIFGTYENEGGDHNVLLTSFNEMSSFTRRTFNEAAEISDTLGSEDGEAAAPN